MTGHSLTQRLRCLALDLGADLFGIAPVARYREAGAPLHMSPEGLLPGATCAVVVGIHHPDAVIERGGEPDPQTQGPYAIQSRMNEKLEHVAFWLADSLEREGHRVLGLPSTNIWRFRGRPEEANPFLPDLSNIHAAWLAGLGEIGWSGLFLSPEFGPRQRLCCLVTDAPLEASPMYSGRPLCDRCNLCVEHCPTEAYEKEVEGEVVLTAGGSTVRYARKSKWRCSWAEHFGLDLDLPKPEVITEEVLMQQLAEHGVRGGEMGCCLRFCMAPQRRYFERTYTQAPRRIRDEPEEPDLAEAWRAACDVTLRQGASLCAAVPEGVFGSVSLDLAGVLPDARSAVAFSVAAPRGAGAPAGLGAGTWVDFIELDLARLLESHGFSALPRAGLDRELVRKLAGFPGAESERGLVGCVVSSAPFEALHAEAAAPAVREQPSDLTALLREQLTEAGAHLVGVAAASVLQDLVPALRDALDEERLAVHVRDAGPTHGATEPVIEPRALPILKGPKDYLPQARAVLVVGVHHPSANLTLAGDPPARAIGPYAFASYQTVRQLDYLAWKAVVTLHHAGYRAFAVHDLSGDAGEVLTPRGLQPDALSSRFAAVAAGLATLGLHGAPITPEYGVTQRFLSIVTDAPLKASSGAPADPCTVCEAPCLQACPVSALSTEKSVELAVGEDCARFARLDRLRCDWAKKYGLVAAEGPGEMGQTTGIEPPEGEITAEAIASAMGGRDPVQRHWTCVVERCLQACQRRLEQAAR